MILFYFPRLVCQFFSIWFFHVDQIGCPMFFVTVFGNYPEHFDTNPRTNCFRSIRPSLEWPRVISIAF
jgi:hypothetical protein